jgi:ribose/xylose/arabinose/galactoside ABC-type transport system permease subunit
MLVEKGQITQFFKHLFRRREAGVFLALVGLFIFLSVGTPYFMKPINLLNIARQISLIAITGVGMTFLIVSGEFDLSVGSIMGFSAILIATFIKNGINHWLSFFIVLAICACIGLINGSLATKVGIPSFIATLGMLSVLRGLTLVLSGGWPISGFESSSFFFLTGSRIIDLIPMQVIWMIVIMIIGSIVMKKTTFGHHVYGTGGNKQAARLSGVNTDRVKITNFILTSVLAAISGTLMLGFLKSATPLAGTGMELNVIAATVIGGTNLFGGAGTILGTFFGATIMGAIRNGMVLMGISAYWQETVIGLVIITAVAIDMVVRRH